jgi:hypothetical protein
MPTIEVYGKSYETDEEGYLVSLGNGTRTSRISSRTKVVRRTKAQEVASTPRQYQIAPAVRADRTRNGSQPTGCV